MAKNVTVSLPEDVAKWARLKAAEQNTSVSRYLCQLLEKQMRMSDEYWEAFNVWKSIQPMDTGVRASERFSREATHER